MSEPEEDAGEGHEGREDPEVVDEEGTEVKVAQNGKAIWLGLRAFAKVWRELGISAAAWSSAGWKSRNARVANSADSAGPSAATN